MALALLLAPGALAVPTNVVPLDLPLSCDTLSVPLVVDELGRTNFPLDSRITTASPGTSAATTCGGLLGDDPLITNQLLRITNQTTTAFAEVWYVADTDTSIANVDGLVDGGQAFRIDKVGLNQPLLSESINNDGVFQPGEQWEILLVDYSSTSPAPLPGQINSLGVGANSNGNATSSGSIIAFVPEPTTALLLAGGLMALGARRRAPA